MNQYTTENPPKRGNGRKIWKALAEAGLHPSELHYNPNNWGRDRELGYGTWACTIWRYGSNTEYLCGILSTGEVYLQGMEGNYGTALVSQIASRLAAAPVAGASA